MTGLVPFTTPVVNPQKLALLNRAPYLTVSEFKYAPHALDLSNLVSPGYDYDQDQSLAQIIARASSAMDDWCFPLGTGGTLSASVDTDTGTMKVRPDGYLPLVCRFKPVLAVTAMSLGSSPADLAPLTDDQAAGLIIDGKVLKVPVNGQVGRGVSTTFLGGARPGGMVYAEWSYIDGYPHTTLAESVEQGATDLVVVSTLGMFPGTTLTIYDGANAEMVMVDEVGSATTFSITAPLRFAHEVPAAPDALSVSALPPAVKQAAIFWTCGLIKARGDSSLVLADSSLDSLAKSVGPHQADDRDAAKEMLVPYRIVRGDK